MSEPNEDFRVRLRLMRRLAEDLERRADRLQEAAEEKELDGAEWRMHKFEAQTCRKLAAEIRALVQ